MNTKRSFIALFALVVIFALGISVAAAQNGCGNNCGNGGNGNGQGNNGYQGGRNDDAQRGNANSRMNGGYMMSLPSAAVDELPEAVVALMVDGWTDEQHAYAVYSAVIDQFGTVRPFTNIQRSELRHITAWETLFDRYGIVVPEVPTFDLPTFATVNDACTVGVAAEITNFDLYDAMLAAFEPYPDLTYVAQNLRAASEFNHLRAFENCAG
ncbi:MAG: DUF2202 domain-containing protein [Pleurocapsa minor GSE-CHR-MK-17-07R]|jgi:hypothetical protein|nr:DUF2202 domain-containing protein [Pleurocapsa minor GSE-CHR-MK 17-07R]